MQSTSDEKRDLIPESETSLVPLFGKSLFEANSDAIESAIHSGLDIMAKNLLDDDSATIASDILENIPFLKWFIKSFLISHAGGWQNASDEGYWIFMDSGIALNLSLLKATQRSVRR